ncbi:hypothetical protein [Bacillus pumilus]
MSLYNDFTFTGGSIYWHPEPSIGAHEVHAGIWKK